MNVTRRSLLATATAVSVPLTGCLGWKRNTDDALLDTTVEGERTFEFEAEEGDRLRVEVTNDVGTLTEFKLRDPSGERVAGAAFGTDYSNIVEASTSGVYEAWVSTEGRATVVVAPA